MHRLARVLPFCLVILSCSDDPAPPLADAVDHRFDGLTDGTRLDQGFPFDGFDPSCPMGPPCILGKHGEGKHAEEMLVIGEILTITGTELQEVDTVYVGAAVAPILSILPTEIRCRIGPKTPPGLNGLEVKSGSKRRKVSGVLIRRLTVVLADDHTTMLTYDTATHTGGPTLTLTEVAAAAPQISTTGRYLIAQGKKELMVADLAREEVAKVEGLEGQIVTSYTTTNRDDLLWIATQGGTVFRANLTAFPTIAAQPQADAPTTLAIKGDPKDTLLVGLHTNPTGQESSVWHSSTNLTSPQWVQKGGQSFVIGSGINLSPSGFHSQNGVWAALSAVEGVAHLAVMLEDSGKLVGEAAGPVPGKSGLVIAAGGAYIALAGNATPPALSFAAISGGGYELKEIGLGAGPNSKILPLQLPSRATALGILVGPVNSGAFIADTLELVDLEQQIRITSAGEAALKLSNMRAAVADPLDNIIHLITNSEFRSYGFSISESSVVLSERQPHMFLPTSREYRWIAVQP